MPNPDPIGDILRKLYAQEPDATATRDRRPAAAAARIPLSTIGPQQPHIASDPAFGSLRWLTSMPRRTLEYLHDRGPSGVARDQYQSSGLKDIHDSALTGNPDQLVGGLL